jgi:hypothetical protein
MSLEGKTLFIFVDHAWGPQTEARSFSARAMAASHLPT